MKKKKRQNRKAEKEERKDESYVNFGSKMGT